MLRDYASLFGRVGRTLYADLEKGKEASALKAEDFARWKTGVTVSSVATILTQ